MIHCFSQWCIGKKAAEKILSCCSPFWFWCPWEVRPYNGSTVLPLVCLLHNKGFRLDPLWMRTLYGAGWYHAWVFSCIGKNVSLKVGDLYVVICPKFWTDYFICTHLGADEVSGEYWQLVAAIRDGADSLTFWEWHSQGHNHTFLLCLFRFGQSWIAVTFKMFLWSFLCNLIDRFGWI